MKCKICKTDVLDSKFGSLVVAFYVNQGGVSLINEVCICCKGECDQSLKQGHTGLQKCDSIDGLVEQERLWGYIHYIMDRLNHGQDKYSDGALTRLISIFRELHRRMLEDAKNGAL